MLQFDHVQQNEVEIQTPPTDNYRCANGTVVTHSGSVTADLLHSVKPLYLEQLPQDLLHTLQSAAARLNLHIDGLTTLQVVERYSALGCQITTDFAARLQRESGTTGTGNSQVAIGQLDHQLLTAGCDENNNSGLHDAASMVENLTVAGVEIPTPPTDNYRCANGTVVTHSGSVTADLLHGSSLIEAIAPLNRQRGWHGWHYKDAQAGTQARRFPMVVDDFGTLVEVSA